MTEKAQWAQWKQEQTKMQLEAFKQDVQSPIRNQVRSDDILSNQQLGANKNTEDMVKNGVMSKFARRKLKKEQEASGIVSEAGSHGGGNGSYGRAAAYDCYNESGWLKVAVRKLEDQNKQLTEERRQLLHEKSLWHTKFQEENRKWMAMVADIKIAKAKMATEVADFCAQRNALRTVEICAQDRKLYDQSMHQMPIPNGIDVITSGNKRLRATELHALLSGAIVSTRTAQSEFLDHFIAIVTEIEELFMEGVMAGANNLQTQQRQSMLVEQVKQWSRHCADLTAAMVNHTKASNISNSNIDGAGSAVEGSADSSNSGNIDNALIESSQAASREIDELKLNNDDLRQTIAQLRSKNAELTRSLKERAYHPRQHHSSIQKHSAGTRAPVGADDGNEAVVGDGHAGVEDAAAESKYGEDEEADSSYHYGSDVGSDYDDLVADVPVRGAREAAAEYGSNYSHIEELLSLVAVDAAGSATGGGQPDSETQRRLQRVNTKEFRLILEAELRDGAAAVAAAAGGAAGGAAGTSTGTNTATAESIEFSSLFPSLVGTGTGTGAGTGAVNDHSDHLNSSTVTHKQQQQQQQSTGRMLFIETLTDPSNRLYHDALHLYLQDLILEHPLLRQQNHGQLGDKIIYVLYDEISEIVAKQICDVVMATLSDKDISLHENELKNELLAIQYLRNNLLPNQQLLNNFITLALHSVTVHPEINALVTMAVSFFFEKEMNRGAQ